MKQPCEVCNKNESVRVVSSALGAVGFAACDNCLRLGAEPYNVVVGGMFGCMNGWPASVSQWAYPIVTVSLQVAGKTIDDLKADVAKLEQDYENAVRQDHHA